MLTVLLATRNRAAIIEETLKAFCRLHQPSSGWKLIVADNGSTDQTPTVLASFAHRLPLCVVSEPTAGKNAALNAGLDLLEGDLTVLTDDDIFPHADWLIELRNAANTQPNYSMFSGRIVPRWEVDPPAWVQWVEKGPVYTLTDPSIKEGQISASSVYGPNMAIRTALFQSGIRFDPSIGPRNSSYAMGSETELTMRLERHGHKAWHVPSAVVEHLVRDYQMRKSWVFQRALRYGRSSFRLRHVSAWHEVRRWTFIPRYYLRQMNFFRRVLQEETKMGWAWLKLNERELFSAHWRRNCLVGIVVEAHLWHRVPGEGNSRTLHEPKLETDFSIDDP
jgi:glycosyltransferase involved in cell wall biosynthesis